MNKKENVNVIVDINSSFPVCPLKTGEGTMCSGTGDECYFKAPESCPLRRVNFVIYSEE